MAWAQLKRFFAWLMASVEPSEEMNDDEYEFWAIK